MNQKYHLQGLNMILASTWFLVASIFLIANMVGTHIGGFTYFISVQLAIFLAVAAILMLPKYKSLHLEKYALSLGLGVLTVVILALVGFYGRSTPSSDGSGYIYYNGGSTDVWVSSHSPATALQGSILDSPTFISKLFNNCKEHMPMSLSSPSCTSDHYLVGVAVSELILTGSVVLGNVLVRRQPS